MSCEQKVWFDDGWVVLQPPGDVDSYEIDIDRITDIASLRGWVDHLSEKAWVDGEHLAGLVRVACDAKGWDTQKVGTEIVVRETEKSHLSVEHDEQLAYGTVLVAKLRAELNQLFVKTNLSQTDDTKSVHQLMVEEMERLKEWRSTE
jgi:hypothetical protein